VPRVRFPTDFLYSLASFALPPCASFHLLSFRLIRSSCFSPSPVSLRRAVPFHNSSLFHRERDFFFILGLAIFALNEAVRTPLFFFPLGGFPHSALSPSIAPPLSTDRRSTLLKGIGSFFRLKSEQLLVSVPCLDITFFHPSSINVTRLCLDI